MIMIIIATAGGGPQKGAAAVRRAHQPGGEGRAGRLWQAQRGALGKHTADMLPQCTQQNEQQYAQCRNDVSAAPTHAHQRCNALGPYDPYSDD